MAVAEGKLDCFAALQVRNQKVYLEHCVFFQLRFALVPVVVVAVAAVVAAAAADVVVERLSTIYRPRWSDVVAAAADVGDVGADVVDAAAVDVDEDADVDVDAVDEDVVDAAAVGGVVDDAADDVDAGDDDAATVAAPYRLSPRFFSYRSYFVVGSWPSWYNFHYLDDLD